MKYLSILAMFVFGLFAAPLKAASPPTTSYNRIVFYLHPDVVGSTSLSTIRTRLTDYVYDLNFILAKNTQHALTFTPLTDVIVTTAVPYDGITPAGGLPTTAYNIRVWVRKSTTVSTYGGGLSHHSDGSAVLTDLFWPQVYNPNTIAEASFPEYSRQIGSILKGYGHIFGVGKVEGETWKMTGAAPVNHPTMSAFIDINAFFWDWNTSDPYWGLRTDYAHEPMITYKYAMLDRAALRSTFSYSILTSTIIRQNYRYPTLPPPNADPSQINLKVTDSRTCLPVTGATVRVTRVDNFLPQTWVHFSITPSTGEVQWNWTPYYGSISTDQIRTVEISAPGYNTEYYFLTSLDLVSSAIYGNPILSQEIFLLRPALAITIDQTRKVTVSNCVRFQSFELQSSTDLNNWSTVVRVDSVSTDDFVYQTPPNAPPFLFYRVVEINACPIP